MWGEILRYFSIGSNAEAARSRQAISDLEHSAKMLLYSPMFRFFAPGLTVLFYSTYG
jgi:hypothetical protein